MRPSTKKKNTGSIVVGDADVDPTLPSHVPGVHEGNWPDGAETNVGGQNGDGKPDPTRSTGINPGDRTPKNPAMPRLPPP